MIYPSQAAQFGKHFCKIKIKVTKELLINFFQAEAIISEHLHAFVFLEMHDVSKFLSKDGYERPQLKQVECEMWVNLVLVSKKRYCLVT